MKITCNKKEFAALVRECYRAARDGSCCGCLFSPVCTSGSDPVYDDQIMTRIEDICEIGEAANG